MGDLLALVIRALTRLSVVEALPIRLDEVVESLLIRLLRRGDQYVTDTGIL